MSLTTFPFYGDRNAMGIVPREKDEAELQAVASAMMSSKTSGKSAYASELRYFDEGKEAKVSWCWRPCTLSWIMLLSGQKIA